MIHAYKNHSRNQGTQQNAEESMAAATKNRWAAVAASIWIECCAGASYSFSIYSHAFKSRFSLTQQQLGLLSFFKDAGECVGLASGFLHDALSPGHVVVAGIAHNVAGYILLWLFLTGHVPAPSLAGLCATFFVAVNSQTYYNTACIVTCVANFPSQRGLVLGLLKGCLGLSSTILAAVWKVLLPATKRTAASFLMVAAVLPATVAAVALPAVGRSPDVQAGRKDTSRLGIVSAPVVVLAFFLMAVSAAAGDNRAVNRVEFAVVLILLSVPCVLARWFGRWETVQYECDCACPLLLAPVATPELAPGKVLKGILRDADFLLVVFASAASLGSGLAAVNSLSQVAASLGYSSSAVGVAVSLISTWQFVGRFGVGVASDYALKHWGLGRPLLTCIAACILGAAYAAVADGAGSLYFVCAAIGLSVGASWSLYPTTVSELFGLAHFGKLYNVLLAANPVASYALSVWVVGYLYDAEAAMQRSSAATSLCMGRRCFRTSFGILAGVALASAAASFLLFCRTRQFYQTLHSALAGPTSSKSSCVAQPACDTWTQP